MSAVDRSHAGAGFPSLASLRSVGHPFIVKFYVIYIVVPRCLLEAIFSLPPVVRQHLRVMGSRVAQPFSRFSLARHTPKTIRFLSLLVKSALTCNGQRVVYGQALSLYSYFYLTNLCMFRVLST